MPNIYKSLCVMESQQAVYDKPSDIVAAAQNGQDSIALTALNMFCEGMGSAAGNLALTLGAKGGIYVAGGVVTKFQDFFIQSDFRRRFEDKGRFVNDLKPIPMY